MSEKPTSSSRPASRRRAGDVGTFVEEPPRCGYWTETEGL